MSTIDPTRFGLPGDYKSEREKQYLRYFQMQMARNAETEPASLEQPLPFTATQGLGSDGMDSLPPTYSGVTGCQTGTKS